MIKYGHAPFLGFRIVRHIVYFICWGSGQMQTAATANESDWKYKPYLLCLLSHHILLYSLFNPEWMSASFPPFLSSSIFAKDAAAPAFPKDPNLIRLM